MPADRERVITPAAGSQVAHLDLTIRERAMRKVANDIEASYSNTSGAFLRTNVVEGPRVVAILHDDGGAIAEHLFPWMLLRTG